MAWVLRWGVWVLWLGELFNKACLAGLPKLFYKTLYQTLVRNEEFEFASHLLLIQRFLNSTVTICRQKFETKEENSECIRDLDWSLIKEARWLFMGHFWPPLKQLINLPHFFILFHTYSTSKNNSYFLTHTYTLGLLLIKSVPGI